MKNFTRQTSPLALAFGAVLLFSVVAFAAGLSYFQGFENDTSGWNGPVARVSSGTNGIVSSSGSWHAQVGSGAFTRWGGYGGISGCTTGCAALFPENGYVTAIDVYLEASSATFANDTRFDFSSAINDPTGGHRRDFAFNAGFYNDSDTTGTGPRFVISASNNTGRANSDPKNPMRTPFAISDDGWYTLQHTFLNDGNGVLKVELSIKDETGSVLHTWVLSDPTDTINGTVGNNRYGLFATQEFAVLGIDNTSRYDILGTPADKEQCKKDGWKQVVNGSGAAFRNQGQCVKFVTTGN